MSKKHKGPLFHNKEISICGFSNSGKTTLIEKLMTILSSEYKIGYVKHDAHRFQIDHEGKDTDRNYRAGAETVYINSSEQWAVVSKKTEHYFLQKQLFLDTDFVLIEGYKKGSTQKMVFVDHESILCEFDDTLEKTIIAFIGTTHQRPQWIDNDKWAHVPYFQRDQLPQIVDFLKHDVLELSIKSKLYGLVLAGGQSSRMQQDKAILEYHGKPQFKKVYELLNQRLEKTFISARFGQRDDKVYDNLPLLHDRLIGCGPMGGILTAMLEHPDAAWLVVACDLPYLNLQTIDQLIHHRNHLAMATCFLSQFDQLPEPMCTIYEKKSKQRLFEALGQGFQCPRKVLINSHVNYLNLTHSNALNNINYPNEFLLAKQELSQNRD